MTPEHDLADIKVKLCKLEAQFYGSMALNTALLRSLPSSQRESVKENFEQTFQTLVAEMLAAPDSEMELMIAALEDVHHWVNNLLPSVDGSFPK